MGDFQQPGHVATLHNFGTWSSSDLERHVEAFSATRKINLILPSLFSELEAPALDNIVNTLSDVRYLNHIVIGLDRANAEQFAFAKQYFSRLPQKHSILWNDGPRLTEIHNRLAEKELAPQELGKGRNVWYCMGYNLACRDSEIVALHDCDIVTYSKEMLTRLVYPLANPSFPYYFAKGFYPRVADGKLNGRVTRLLVTPLLMAIEKTCGRTDYVDYLQAFRYPLAGEFAMRTSVLSSIRIPSDWGLEIGVLSEVSRNLSRHAICQVDIADTYDHKHQPLSQEDASRGLSRMSMDISKSLFRKLATEGMEFTGGTFRTIKAVYYRIALDMIEMYYNDAMMNGLHLDRHKEEQAVELFAANIMEAGKTFIDNPMETPFIANWSRVRSAEPDIMRALRAAVEEDNA
ncbi:glycosyl transferase [Pseudohoeflea suaedae]|uniref:Glycosyl transferase n=1 Tax=Pseudohoeflea suaedae TaxID=877384 RepID=A0A4R5PP20_9HYPH|nr:glycosyl transferase [Pseudohoeflea suaedae]TDH38337.1 glycosyl transferase [Pseudohoeflea suaedae]